MIDDLEGLRTFQRVVRLGSLSAAARELGLGLPVVSKRLSTLERRLGVRLVNRTTRRLSATEEGVSLLAHVERVLDELGQAEAEIAGAVSQPRGLLRIASPVSFGRRHLAPLAAQLTALYPDLRIDLRLDDRLVDLVDERLDLSIRVGPPADSAFLMRKLADNHRILVASPGYLDHVGRPSSPADFGGVSFLRYDDGDAPWRLTGPRGEVAQVQARPRLRADSGEVVHDWALAGLGIMLKSQIDVAADLAAGRLEQVAPGWRSPPAPIYALFPSGRLRPSKVRVFVDALETALRPAIVQMSE